VANQALRAAKEFNAALTRDLEVVQASTATLNEDLEVAQASTTATNQELSSKLAALDELMVQEQAVQDKLQALREEKRLQEQVLESTQKMLSECDYSSSMVISLDVAHAVALLKIYVSDLDTELLCVPI
jgi:chromosome segregation ATPase